MYNVNKLILFTLILFSVTSVTKCYSQTDTQLFCLVMFHKSRKLQYKYIWVAVGVVNVDVQLKNA